MHTLFFTFIATLSIFCHPSYASENQPLRFLKNGKLIKALSLSDLKQTVSPIEVTLLEPHELKNKTYAAFPFEQLLKQIYGDQSTRKSYLIQFTCIDGYMPKIKFENLQFQPFLAFAEKNKTDFKIIKNKKATIVAPYYLVWKHNLQSGTKLETHLNAGHWPYQLVAVDLIAN